MPIIKHPDQRVGIFIDTQNFYHSAKNLFSNARVNFGAILRDGVAGRKLIRAMAYVISTKTGEEQSFFDALGKIGIEIRVKELQEFYGGAKKADWDVGLAVDAITLAPKLDTIIICSGDGDFVPLIEFLRMNAGVQVEVIAFGQSASGKLKEAADDFFDLSLDPEAYLIGYRGRGRSDGRSGDTEETATEDGGEGEDDDKGGRGRSRRAVSL
jgi:uncharacterized LabA/DUF88 family protein